jgi:alanine racemase
MRGIDETVWLELSQEALIHNVKIFKDTLAPGTRLAAVVKGNAYGHGLVAAATCFLKGGADWLCVNSVYEAEALANAGINAPCLIMGYVPLGQLARALKVGSRVLVYQAETIRALSEAAVLAGVDTAKVHLKVETGNNRQGVEPDLLIELARLIKQLPGVELEGLSSHYADIEDTTNHDFAQHQLNVFKAADKALRAEGLGPDIRHFSNSAATMLWPDTHFEMVRIGISLYGLWPSKETYISALVHGVSPMDLKPALTWKTRIAQIKHLRPGESVGYGRSFRTTHQTRTAVLPVGYYDGYDRGLGNLAYVLINGHICPVRGRVCMNMIMVDVTDVPDITLEQEVIILGGVGPNRISAEQLAEWSSTINYEVTTRINPKTTRIMVP